ncbi:MAG: BON domain-containing protein [Burkholderiales bacterium]
MQMRTKLASALTVLALVTMSGCAVHRGQETAGAYVDDTAITTAVKSRYVGNKEVDASSISVETLNGTVMLSGFAKNQAERTSAEDIAMKTNGVKSVKNAIVVRP